MQTSFKSKVDESKLTSKQRQRLLVERIFLAIFWIFIVLGIIALFVFGATYTLPSVALPTLIVGGGLGLVSVYLV